MQALSELRTWKKLTVSGPEFFGLSNSLVMSHMARMPNADRCVGFTPLRTRVIDASESSDSETPSRPAKAVRSVQVPPGRSFKVNFKSLIVKARNLKLSEDVILHQFGEIV
jgi:hypothetical protein